MEEKKKMPNIMRSAAAVMAADMLLLLGFIFMLFGAAKYINDMFDIPGIGEGSLGLLLFVIGLIVILKSKMKVQMRPMQMKQQMPQMPPSQPQPPPSDVPPGTYR